MTVIMSANKLRKCLLKLLALVIVSVTVFGITAYAEGDTTSSSPATTDSLSELQSKYDKIENQISQNQEKLEQVQDNIDAKEETVDQLDNKIGNTQEQVNLLLTQQRYLNTEITNAETQIGVITAQLTSLSEQIEATEDYITEKQAMLDATYDLLKMRIRAMYMAGNGSTIEFLLTSEDFSTLLTRAELLVRVAKHDKDLMNSIGSDIEALSQLEAELSADIAAEQKKRDELNAKTQKLESSKEEIKKNSDKLAEKQAQLEKEMDLAEKELQKLDKESDEYKAAISKQEDELLALSNQMEEFIKNNGSSTNDKPVEEKPNNTVTPGATTGSSGTTTGATEENNNQNSGGSSSSSSSGMIFPLKCSGVYMSSPYGMRTHPITGERKLHTGIDLTAGGIDGKTVYAVKDGEVIYAAKQTGYGNFVIIDHGNGVSSCYAHMQDNSLTVSVGQKVVQGQAIGKVGSTGYSTGPHLHFEIRVNGKTTNPLDGYIQLPG